jgi:tRNA (guanine37-N1)-methyltransferase
MKIQVITLFPGILEGPLSESIVGLVRQKGILNLDLVDLRSYCRDKHRTADDTPYGGGGGMVLKAGPVVAAVQDCKKNFPGARVIYLSPQGTRLDHARVEGLAKEKGLILLCGRYEGVDQRALDSCVDEEISIGDYVLTGGELAAGVIVEAVARLLPGALGHEDSAKNDWFYNGLLDFPHYTRPPVYEGSEVPEVLMSGNHEEIRLWRRRESLKRTFEKRPDLLDRLNPGPEDLDFLKELGWEPVRAEARGFPKNQKTKRKERP